MDSLETLRSKEVRDILARYHVRSLKVFGSYRRGTARPDSDVDLLVQFRVTPSLLGLIRMQDELSDALGIKVDLVTEQALSPYMRDDVLHEASLVYEAQ